jgi:hypothetical protein
MPKFDIGSTATNAIGKAKTLVDSTMAKGLSGATDLVNKSVAAINSGVGLANNLLNGAVPGGAAVPGASVPLETVTKVPMGITGRLPNILGIYSSFNYNFTLSVLDDASLNFPNETYRKGILGPLILKSGNAQPADRISTIYKSAENPSGSFDFFMEELTINHVIGFEKSTGNSNATGFSCKIIEPYSMGLFFQVLQKAARDAGHKNYLDVPLLLTIDFKGHIDPQLQNVQIPNTTKYYPLKIRTLSTRVSGEGSVYDIALYPYNEAGYSSSYSQLKTAVSIKGQTVLEMLQTGDSSLQKVLNDRLLESVKRGSVNIPDQILISFPIDLKSGDAAAPTSGNSATVNPGTSGNAGGDLFSRLKLKVSDSAINKTQIQVDGTVNTIGLSSMGFNLYQGASTPYAKDNLAYDADSGVYKRSNVNLEIKPSECEFRFGQGSDVINAINQVILMSEYGRTALSQITSDGFIKWWRVETHVYNIPTDANLAKTGTKPKLIMYRVVPYDANASEFTPPNSSAPGIENDKKQVLKEYNYIYSGRNTEILDFEIEFKAGFYTALSSDIGANNDSVLRTEQASSGSEGEETQKNKTAQGSAVIKDGALPTSRKYDSVNYGTGSQGGGGLEDSASIAARQFHDAITSGVDMIGLDLTILGDPYYLGDSGMGNYSAVAGDNKYITSDQSMNWQSGEVHVLVNFRTPTDINQSTGMFNFTSTGSVPQFSGLYRVLRAESSFRTGRFVQTLKMIRLPNQEAASTSASLSVLPEAIYVDDNGEEAFAALKDSVEKEGVQASPLTDEQTRANNAALGDFAG